MSALAINRHRGAVLFAKDSVKLIVQPDAHDVAGYPAADRARARRLNVGASSAAKLITRAP
jgi:hypothetical protein